MQLSEETNEAQPEVTYSCILQHPDGHEIVIPGPPKENGWDWTEQHDFRLRAVFVSGFPRFSEISKYIYYLQGTPIPQSQLIFNHLKGQIAAKEYGKQAMIEKFRVLEWTKWEKAG